MFGTDKDHRSNGNCYLFTTPHLKNYGPNEHCFFYIIQLLPWKKNHCHLLNLRRKIWGGVEKMVNDLNDIIRY